MYHWCITNVGDEDDKRFIGTVGPSTAKMTYEEIRYHPDRKLFALLDDDNETMAMGFYVGDGSELEPLDDFGTPECGCTTISYWSNKEQRFVAIN